MDIMLPAAFGAITLSFDATGCITRVRLDAAPPRGSLPIQSPPTVGHACAAVTQLQEYLAGRRRGFELCVAATGTPFQQQVWQALEQTAYGDRLSYATVAANIGRPAAVRAVAAAIAANPLPIIVPCHRVIHSDGRIGNYALRSLRDGSGAAIKHWLLALESQDTADKSTA